MKTTKPSPRHKSLQNSPLSNKITPTKQPSATWNQNTTTVSHLYLHFDYGSSYRPFSELTVAIIIFVAWKKVKLIKIKPLTLNKQMTTRELRRWNKKKKEEDETDVSQVRKRWKEGKFKTKQQEKLTWVSVPVHMQSESESTWFLVLFLLGFSFQLVFASLARETVPIRACFSSYLWRDANEEQKTTVQMGFCHLVDSWRVFALFLFSRLTFPLFSFALLFAFPRFHVFNFRCVCCVVFPSFSTVSFCNCVVINRYNFSFSLYFFLSTNNF